MEQNEQPPVLNSPQIEPPQYQYEPQYQPQYQSQYTPMMPFWEAVKTCFRKYFDFKGRARRSEYWWFILFECVLTFVWAFLCGIVMTGLIESSIRSEPMGDPLKIMFISAGVMVLPMLFFIIPQYAAMTRRIHDSGHSGWWVFASFITSLLYMVFYFCVFMPKLLDDSDALFSSPGLWVVAGLLGLISSILGIILLVFTIMDGEPGENKYGPSPKFK